MQLIDSSHKPENPDKPCRTCVDFKTWAKTQRKSLQKPEKSGEIVSKILKFVLIVDFFGFLCFRIPIRRQTAQMSSVIYQNQTAL